MRTLLFKLIVVLAYALMTSGCATIIGQSSAAVTINTVPDKVETKIINSRGQEVASQVTPFTIVLRKKEGDFDLKFSPENGEKIEAKIEKHVNMSYLFGNLMFGGLIGWLIVDPISGSMWSFSQDTYKYDLSRASNGVATAEPSRTPLQLYGVKSAEQCSRRQGFSTIKIKSCEREVSAYLMEHKKSE